MTRTERNQSMQMTITLTREEAHKLLTALEELNRLSTGKNA